MFLRCDHIQRDFMQWSDVLHSKNAWGVRSFLKKRQYAGSKKSTKSSERGLNVRPKSVVVFTLVFALACAAIFLPVAGSQVRAQQNRQSCKAFHAFVQGRLPTTNQFAPTDTWGGPIFVNLDGEFLQGGLSGNDGTEYPHGPVSIFKGGEYKLCLTSAAAWGGPNDCSDSFTYKVPQAVVIWPAGKVLGSYKATANVVKGTGRFAPASGQLEIEGPFILWTNPNSVFGVSGRWNGEFSGRICGVQ